MTAFRPYSLKPFIYVSRKPDKPNILIGRVGFTVACRVVGHTVDSMDEHIRYRVGYPRNVRAGFEHFIWMHVTSEGYAPVEVEFELYPPRVNTDEITGTELRVPVVMF